MTCFDIFCHCGDVIEADTREEAINKFCEKHNFKKPNTFPPNRHDYTEEYEIKELK